jgi:hypothetical protein
MRYPTGSIVGVLALAGVFSGGCTPAPSSTASAESASHVEHIEGSDLSRVTLSERAMERTGVETAGVLERMASRYGAARLSVPYSALLYDTAGRTWVYTSPEPRTFVREEVVVDYIEGDVAILSSGPTIGTVVASVGVAELYGTEFEVGH